MRLRIEIIIRSLPSNCLSCRKSRFEPPLFCTWRQQKEHRVTNHTLTYVSHLMLPVGRWYCILYCMYITKSLCSFLYTSRLVNYQLFHEGTIYCAFHFQDPLVNQYIFPIGTVFTNVSSFYLL